MNKRIKRKEKKRGKKRKKKRMYIYLESLYITGALISPFHFFVYMYVYIYIGIYTYICIYLIINIACVSSSSNAYILSFKN